MLLWLVACTLAPSPDPMELGRASAKTDDSGIPCSSATDGLHDFLFCTELLSWSDAEAACAAWGYHLVDVEDSTENQWIYAEAEAVQAGQAWWLGYSDLSVEGTFSWDGGSTATWTAWRPGEPNNFNGAEDCTKFFPSGAGLWNDADCNSTLAYICEAGCLIVDAYTDADGDGFGDSSLNQRSCTPAAGTVPVGGDCDDTDPALSPGAAEVCGGGDEDCDSLADDADPSLDSSSAGAWYDDTDGDGFGAGSARYACLPPVGSVADNTDCDDGDATIFPGAGELRADGIDQDCDGSDTCLWYADGDGDGFGDPASPSPDCSFIAGYVAAAGDCDDTNATILPTATEIWYDGVDQNCDGLSDQDADADGIDDAGHGGSDCDDQNAAVRPGLAERCDGLDQDCDGSIDGASCPCPQADYADHSYLFCTSADLSWEEAELACAALGYELVTIGDGSENSWLWTQAESADPVSAWWIGLSDRDVEGSYVWADGSPLGYSLWRTGEPNDFNGAEDCGKYIDNSGGSWNDGNCDDPLPYICEAGCPMLTYHPDTDGDGYGDATDATQSCTPIAGLVADGSDCDDSDATVGPGSTEVCGGGDEDCDGFVDDNDGSLDESTATSWWPDEDGDGWGRIGEVVACDAPEGYAPQTGDCNDLDPSIRPGASEAADGVDNDCDGFTELDDQDGDGLSQLVEDGAGSNPFDPDTDADGVSDGDEVVIIEGKARDTDKDGLPDFADPDDDNDGVSTLEEAGDADLATPPPDSDGDGLVDPLDPDSDNDGLYDGAESGDFDADALPDRTDSDDDGDGIDTATELAVDGDLDGRADYDSDGDGSPNHLDLDSDGDGCADATEGDGDGNANGVPDFADGVCGEVKDQPCGCSSGSASVGPIGLLLLLLSLRRAALPSRGRSPQT
jgi:large repetitive protein